MQSVSYACHSLGVGVVPFLYFLDDQEGSQLICKRLFSCDTYHHSKCTEKALYYVNYLIDSHELDYCADP